MVGNSYRSRFANPNRTAGFTSRDRSSSMVRSNLSNSGRFTCASGDCNSNQIQCNGAGPTLPASLVEFTLAGDQGRDFYDVSLVDGLNLPISVSPVGGNCPTTSCSVDVKNNGCPNELIVRGRGGAVVGCKSVCVAFKPQYCCSGAFNSPATCKPTRYSVIFKWRCLQAYSYAYDDETSTFTCPTGKNYLITFCP